MLHVGITGGEAIDGDLVSDEVLTRPRFPAEQRTHGGQALLGGSGAEAIPPFMRQAKKEREKQRLFPIHPNA